MLRCGLNTQMEVSILCLDSQVLSITRLRRTTLEVKKGVTKIVKHLHCTSLSPPGSHSSPEKQVAGSLCSSEMSRLSASNRFERKWQRALSKLGSHVQAQLVS